MARPATTLWRDPAYLGLLIAALPVIGLLAWATPAAPGLRWPGTATFVIAAAALPVIEEIVFRLGVHDALSKRLGSNPGVFAPANLLTAALFALAHLWHHPPAWALATFVPALAFGWVWQRHRRLIAPISLHAFYNAAYLCLLS